MTVHPVLVFLAGLVVITLGAELLLRTASRLAALLGLEPIVIGLTVVAIGTSLPELAVGIAAASGGSSELAVANIAGTNIANILLILGLSAAIRALPLRQLSIRLDVPLMIATSIVLVIMAADGILSTVDGVLLILGALIYFVALLKVTRREKSSIKREYAEEYSPGALFRRTGPLTVLTNLLGLAAGIALTIFGAELLVDGAVAMARALGVSDAIIGLTIVAVGTSAPELATTLVATIKDDRDVAVGNLLGSSITNILFILGITIVASPNDLEVSREILLFDLPLSAAVAIACYPVFRSGQRVSRLEGVIFVSLYVLYVGVLIFIRA
ncbi:MAG: calcium/sodium antiporter [Bacteroidota bacterium]|jgi:cation:H+ antiporter|nr:MAG: sodium:calcium antiporter [Bacteroidota bacterium]